MRRREAYTYKEFEKLARELPPEVLAFMPFTHMHSKKDDSEYFWFADVCGGIRMSENHKMASSRAPYAYEFRSLCMSVPLYTKWLVEQLQGPLPGPVGPPVEFVRVTTLESLTAAAHIVRSASLLVNATGLGSQDLAEVQDKSVYPIRGQVVLVDAPRFRDANVARCVTFIDGAHSVYVIPRARSGHVILGGTFDVGVSNPLQPNRAVTERILREAVKAVPELLPDGVDASAPDAWRRLRVISENVGLRPARRGGARVELDAKPITIGHRNVGVIHAYGIGPAGYQTSHGIAAEVGALADQWLAAHGRARL